MNKLATGRIAAVLIMAAVSTSTFAQSNEYRRGYQDGFAAGQREASDGHRDRRVHIEEAEYGVRGAVCDAREAVRDQARRNDGAVHAGNDLCGDPARGAPKHLRIIYRCGESQALRAVAREGETVRLSCRRDG
jgi:hypothetical protein